MILDFVFSGNLYKRFVRKDHIRLPGLMNQVLKLIPIDLMHGQPEGRNPMESVTVRENNKRI